MSEILLDHKLLSKNSYCMMNSLPVFRYFIVTTMEINAIQSFEVTHDFITILSLILHSCLDNLNWNRSSRPFGLLTWLTTHKKNEYGSLISNHCSQTNHKEHTPNNTVCTNQNSSCRWCEVWENIQVTIGFSFKSF